jgi:hypothetical protein
MPSSSGSVFLLHRLGDKPSLKDRGMSALILQDQTLLNLWASARSALGPNEFCAAQQEIPGRRLDYLKNEQVNRRIILGITNLAAAAAIVYLACNSCYFLPRTQIPLVRDHNSGVCD